MLCSLCRSTVESNRCTGCGVSRVEATIGRRVLRDTDGTETGISLAELALIERSAILRGW